MERGLRSLLEKPQHSGCSVCSLHSWTMEAELLPTDKQGHRAIPCSRHGYLISVVVFITTSAQVPALPLFSQGSEAGVCNMAVLMLITHSGFPLLLTLQHYVKPYNILFRKEAKTHTLFCCLTVLIKHQTLHTHRNQYPLILLLPSPDLLNMSDIKKT